MAKAPAGEMGKDQAPMAPKSKMTASDGVCDGEDFRAATEPWFTNPDNEITGMEIGEPTNQPGNPWGPDGLSDDMMHEQPVSPATKVAAKSSPSKMAGGASKVGSK